MIDSVLTTAGSHIFWQFPQELLKYLAKSTITHNDLLLRHCAEGGMIWA